MIWSAPAYLTYRYVAGKVEEFDVSTLILEQI